MGRRSNKITEQDLQRTDFLSNLAAKQRESMGNYRKAGNKIITQIRKILCRHSSFKICRFTVAGSIGKRVSLGHESVPDFDVILFVNDVMPPLTDVVQDFYNTLLDHCDDYCDAWLRFDKNEMTARKNSLNFFVETLIQISGQEEQVTIEFDLLPGANLIPHLCMENLAKGQSVNLVRAQSRAALKLICETSDPSTDWRSYSTSLAEKTVWFTLTQREFVHNAVILAKLWNSNVEIDEKIYGRFLLELIAIKASYQCGSNLAMAFRKFLKSMKNFRNLQVVLHHENLSRGLDVEVMKEAMSRHCRPVVRDHANPFNNLADNVSQEAMEIFHERAKETLRALQDMSLFDQENIEDFMGIPYN